ncbi:MAG: trypco2 family protein [Methanoregula sp.]
MAGDIDIKTVEVTDVIDTIKEVISEAGLTYEIASGKDNRIMKIDTIELTLKVLNQKDAGGKIKFSVPLSIDLGGEISKMHAQTIAVTFSLPKEKPVQMRHISKGLKDEAVEAIATLKKIIDHALSTTPVFELKSAKIQLDFSLTMSGGIELFVKANSKTEFVNCMVLNLSSLN